MASGHLPLSSMAVLSCSRAMGTRSLPLRSLKSKSPLHCRTQEQSLMEKFAPSDKSGRPQFKNLMFHRGNPPCFFAFDLLTCNGKDLRTERLLDRKQELRRLLAKVSPPFPLRYAEHVERSGTALFQRVCELDLEGIVAKHKFGPYVAEREHSSWFKILNREYSKKAEREALFEREPHSEPVAGWHSCDLACAILEGVASMPERR